MQTCAASAKLTMMEELCWRSLSEGCELEKRVSGCARDLRRKNQCSTPKSVLQPAVTGETREQAGQLVSASTFKSSWHLQAAATSLEPPAAQLLGN